MFNRRIVATALAAGGQSTRVYSKSAYPGVQAHGLLSAPEEQRKKQAVRVKQQNLSPQPLRPLELRPQIFSPELELWASFKNTESNHGTLRTGCIHTLPKMGINKLSRDRILKIVSWNLEFDAPDPDSRATAAISHLESLFGSTPDDLVIMLQEVCSESYRAIHENSWVRQNFISCDASSSGMPDIPSFRMSDTSSFGMPEPWKAAYYHNFNMMMIPRSSR
jgi:hypothetical protein